VVPVRVEPVRDNHGDIFKWYGANTDIEDRKRAEALLAAEKTDLGNDRQRGLRRRYSGKVVRIDLMLRPVMSNRQ